MSNVATVTFIPCNSPAGSLLLLLFKSKSLMSTFVFELSLPIQPTLISFQPRLHMSSPALSALIFTLLCALSDEGRFLLTNPCFSPVPGYFPPQPFLQTSYTLTLDIASLILYILQNYLHHPEMVDCFILSLIKYQQKWSCDLKDIRS